jgi:hypothetical protein
MLLAEDQLTLRPRDGPPLRDPPLQRAQHALVIVAMAAAQLFEDGGGAQMRMLRQHRHDLAVPHLLQRIDAGALARPRRPLAWQGRIGVETSRRALAHARLHCRHGLRRTLSSLVHIPPHLLIGDPLSWH